jgi:DNA-binding MarR family transcriptional regulator
VHGDRELEHVEGHEPEDVAGPRTAGTQPTGEAPHAVHQLAVAQRPPGRGIDQRDRSRPSLRAPENLLPTTNERVFTVLMGFRRTARLMVEELARRLEADGFGEVQPAYHALFESIDPAGTRLTELAARADMTHQSMSELVAGMEGRGWVERHPDPTDRRARLVCLTPEGRELARRGLHHINEIEAKWQARWQEAGYDGQLRDVLEHAIDGEERARQTTSAAT